MNVKSKSTLEKFKSELRFKKYSENTIAIYLHYAGYFLSNFDEDVYHISQSKAVCFLKAINYTSISQQNQLISSVKLLYKYVVCSELKLFSIERPRKQKQLPKVIDNDYLLNCIKSIKNIKHQTIISLGYSVGLRVSEIINLKIEDIDSKRMIINIRNSKGNKDRLVPLSQNILMLLREYYKECRPYKYLFNGQNSIKYTSGSCNKIVKKYLGNNFHFHQLRHSCFTNLLENGTDLRIIQKLAGHNSSKTTEIYTHVSNNLLQKIKLPL